jgi:hypothetical protein
VEYLSEATIVIKEKRIKKAMIILRKKILILNIIQVCCQRKIHLNRVKEKTENSFCFPIEFVQNVGLK